MLNNDLWYKNAVFYEVYVRAFRDSNGDGNGDLTGLMSKLDYFKELGITCLWLLPIYPSPLLDDGYDIADYYDIHPDYGTLDDFKAFLDTAHSRNIRVITDLVLNHTSDQHPWFQSARADRSSPFRDYYVWSDTEEKYRDARIIFLDTEKSNWTWDERAGQFFWHRFYSSQPDLNFDNPAVQAEMVRVMKFWLDLGVDGFRADAVPYLYEREGTNCENLPETHQYLKHLRRFMDEHYPGRILLCEANQWPEDVRAYFGDGDEFHLGFHFPLMPRVFMALKRGERSSIEWILSRTPEIPENCQWCTFLRNHDELTLEMVTEEERQWMWQEYAPDPRMRLNLGIRRRLAPLLDNNRSKIEVANSLLFTLTGSPVIYYGDELGMGDNIWLEDRDGVRTPMQWDLRRNAGFSEADPGQLYSPVIEGNPYGPERVSVSVQKEDPGSLLNVTRKMLSVHKTQKPLGWGELEWLPVENMAVAAYIRRYREETLLILNNLSGSQQTVRLSLSAETAVEPVDVLSGDRYPALDRGQMPLTLQPYQYLWLKI